MDLISLTDSIESDLDSSLSLPGHYVAKYVRPYPLSADRAPILAVYPTGESEAITLTTGEVVNETATIEVLWGESVADNTDVGRPHEAERVKRALQRAELVKGRLLTYSAGFPGDDRLIADVVSASYGRGNGTIWRAIIRLEINELV